MYRLAHISDTHLGPMTNISWTKLLSKRLTGYINWQRNRAKQFSPVILSGLMAHLLKAGPDHIVITGDLINLSLKQEIVRAKAWLETLGTGKDISIVCGNHDAYIKGMLEVAIQSWQAYLIGDNQQPVIDNSSFPVLRRRGPCSLILVNTAMPTKPFNASGFFGNEQAEKLEQMLQQEKDNCRVILIHHPPYDYGKSSSNQLIGYRLFQDVIHQSGAELILHGHTHLDTIRQIENPKKPVPVICVPAAGQEVGGRKPPARYNWFEIEGKSGNWNIKHNQFGYRDNNEDIIQL